MEQVKKSKEGDASKTDDDAAAEAKAKEEAQKKEQERVEAEVKAAEAAKARRAGRAVRAGLIVPEAPLIEHGGPASLEALCSDPRFALRVPVQVNGKRVMRTRPRFPDWSVHVELHHLPGLLDQADVVAFLRMAGTTVGIGDWRPRFGRFRVEIPV